MKTAPAAICLARRSVATIKVAGSPKGQPRVRAFVRGGRAAVYDPGTAEGWKGSIAAACKELEGLSLTGPLVLSLTFYMPRPKSHFRANGTIKATAPPMLHTNKPDADNLAKAVMDCFSAIRVWIDDDQVCELTVRKWWERPSDAPGCKIMIFTLTEEEITATE